MKFLASFINLLLYGNFWIAGCALALFFQTELIFGKEPIWSPLAGFVFFSTLFLYSIHRIIGIRKMKAFLEKDRFVVIAKFRHHILIYGIIGAAFSCYYFFQLSLKTQLLVVLPAFLSLGYTLPVFKGKMRLRDFHYVKILLIATVWAWVTVILPAAAEDRLLEWSILGVFLERAFFIFSITIPFDIRDLKFDVYSGVKTIPGRIGVRKSVRYAFAALLAASVISLSLGGTGFYGTGIQVGILVNNLLVGFLIAVSPKMQHDYFFSGAVDGTMISQFLLVLLFNYLF